MSIDPDEIWRERHREMGRLLEQEADVIVARWFQRAIEEQPTASSAYREEMHDHLPAFVRALGRDLAAANTGWPAATNLHAAEHGEQRWRVGWQLAEVVRDYQILRLVVLERLEEVLPRPMLLREIMAIGLALDEAITAAVVMYVAHQEEATRRNEESLRSAKDAAETANRAKGDFVANISHELRTPMNSILGMTQLALGEQLSPAVRDYLHTIKDSADGLVSLLNETLDYSRLESGRLELDPHPFNLRTVLDDTLRSLSVAADEKHLELVCDMPGQVTEMLVGDSFRLRQIVTNLVCNAIKFTERGEVVVRVAPQAEAQGILTLEFVVADTGIGIAQDVQQTIFEPFAQAEASTAREYGGTGLGLAIAKELTTRMGGKLWVESQPGRGSKFHFSAKFERFAGASFPQPRMDLLERLRGVPVLVVDDNAATRRVVERALTDWGLVARTVADTATAENAIRVAVAEGMPFKLLIVDADMPAVSGFELVERLRAEQGHPPRIAMMFSNIHRSSSVARGEVLGVVSYLIKPVSSPDLLDTVLEAFDLAAHDDQASESARSMATGPRRRVLLAEDTPANQKLFRALLTKRGHEVVVVDNGRQAVERWQSEPFDVVLMDLQMPVMDGLKATAIIRALEKPRGSRVPIVALTAHALPSDKERCLAAGMDAYLPKPIDVDALESAVASLTDSNGNQSSEPDKAPTFGEAVINRDRALERLGGDERLFSDLVGFFFDDAPDLMNRVRDGMQSGEAANVQRAAHSLKGLAANFDCARVVEAARRIEELADRARLSEIPTALETLVVEIEQLYAALQQYKP